MRPVRPLATSNRLRRWINQYTVPKLVRDISRESKRNRDPRLAVSRQAAYGWARGTRAPAPRRALMILRLSNGLLSIEDVVGGRIKIVPARRPR